MWSSKSLLFYGALPLLLLLCWALLTRDAHSRTLAEDMKGDTSFALKLLIACSEPEDPKNENIVISPVSVFIALAMVGLGSDGKTEEQFQLVLGDSFVNLAQQQSKVLGGMESQITVANAIFQTGLIHEEFSEELAKLFKAEIRSDMNMAAINQWCYEKTSGKIEQVLKDDLDWSTKAVVVNALYLKAMWMKKFDKELTIPGKFDERYDVNYMQKKERMGYFTGKDEKLEFQAVVLPYEKNLEMLVVLPGPKSLLSDVLSSELVHRHIKRERWNYFEVSLTLPRMKLSYEIDLTVVLNRLGLVDAFTEDASFEKMSSTPLHISKVYHKVVMEVDEDGTSGAAVTVVDDEDGCGQSSPCKTMMVDRPFLLIVRTTRRKIIVFEALVKNPMEHGLVET